MVVFWDLVADVEQVDVVNPVIQILLFIFTEVKQLVIKLNIHLHFFRGW